MFVAPILVVVAAIGAFSLAPLFGVLLLGYLALTTAYTFVLKRKMMMDVGTLAILYTLRVVGGAAAIAVFVSEWLLAFSMFMFVALALIKRYTELAGRLDANFPIRRTAITERPISASSRDRQRLPASMR